MDGCRADQPDGRGTGWSGRREMRRCLIIQSQGRAVEERTAEFQPRNVPGIATVAPRDERKEARRRSMAGVCLAMEKAHERSEGSWTCWTGAGRQEASEGGAAGIVHYWRSRHGFCLGGSRQDSETVG